jgi:hypothetical protein
MQIDSSVLLVFLCASRSCENGIMKNTKEDTKDITWNQNRNN